MPPHVRDHSTDEYLAQGLFFREEAVQVGKTITLYFPLAASAPLGLLPRHVADSIPFSTSSLPERPRSARCRQELRAGSQHGGDAIHVWPATKGR